ncbi:uncharacterized protein [Montipora capricornis]|uniref:uncharacterized protein n=1 Tax=Montipora capricornis TaxID=246305 RepID=UPI0035F15A4E
MSALSIASLISFFREEQKSIKKGENHYKSGHVESFTYSHGILRGDVHASMRNKVYKVAVYLNSENAIRSSECECPRGKFKCSHAAALFIHGIYNLSRTDVECNWKKRKASTPLSWQAVEEMFPPTKQYSCLSRNPTQSDRSALYRDLKEYGRFTDLCWLMSPEPATVSKLPIPTIEDIIYSEEFLKTQGSQQQIDCLVRQAKIPDEYIFKISDITIGQRNNPTWHLTRRGRLTASNFGCVLKAKRVTFLHHCHAV